MRSVVIEQPGRLALQTRALPQPAAGEVRVKVKFAGICGSDSHIYRGHNPFARYPRVIGHEFFGLIDALGEGVDPARLGERVSVDPVISCGHCYPCSVGRPNVCTSLVVLGVHRDGGFSEYACVPARNAYPVPPAISDRHAAMIEPFSIAANITAHLQPRPDDIALIYGAGPMGLTVIQALKGVYGVKQVWVVDRIAERLDMARANGADETFNNAEAALPQALQQRGIQPTLIVDAACHPAILQEAIALASPAARIVHHGLFQRRLQPDCPAGHHRQRAVDLLLAPEQRTLPAGDRLDGGRQARPAAAAHPLRARRRRRTGDADVRAGSVHLLQGAAAVRVTPRPHRGIGRLPPPVQTTKHHD